MRISILVVLLLLVAHATEAQRLSQYSRATVSSPQVLARGGTAVAWPSAETSLFYNPAHLARLDRQRPRVEILSVQGGLSTNFLGNLGFLLNDVQGAAEDGIQFPLTARERDLFDEALERGRHPTLGQAAVALPVVYVSTGNAGFAGGLFGTNTTRLKFDDIGGGVPLIDFFSQLDVIGAGGAGILIPQTPLAAGATVRVARRNLASKRKDFLSLDPANEQIYVLSGTAVALDAGLHAADVVPSLPGELGVGLAVYDLIGGGFSYELDRGIAFVGNGDVDQHEVDRILASLEGRDGNMTVRVGAAYRLPGPVGPLADVTIGADWFSGSTSGARQVPLAGVRLGAEANLSGILSLRTGLGQGYPSAGFGLRLPGVRLDYSIHGVEEGRQPGQLQRYDHMVRLRFGLF